MFRPNDSVDWPGLWADLLQGIGAGLLQNDGSRLAQAALMGLDVFDAAQERRGRRKSGERDPSGEHREQRATTLPWPDMSGAELAAFQRLSPEERRAFQAEIAEAGLKGDLPVRRPPASASPFDGWSLEEILPFGRDGRLNIPPFRR